MSKKIITVCLIVVLSLAVVCCAACVKNDHTEEMRLINTLLGREYREIEINVTTTLDTIVLKGKYDIEKDENKTNLAYEVDRLNSFDTSNGSLNAPNEIISHLSGSAVFENKRIVSIDGDEISDSELFEIVEMNMAFRAPYFSDVTVNPNSLYAKVTNPKGFMQDKAFDGSNMDVKVVFNKTAIALIVINYTTSNNTTVKLEYAFTR